MNNPIDELKEIFCACHGITAYGPEHMADFIRWKVRQVSDYRHSRELLPTEPMTEARYTELIRWLRELHPVSAGKGE